MQLIYGFNGAGGWNAYFRAIGREPGCVAVPLSAAWQNDADMMRRTTEACIRSKTGNTNIANTIERVQFLGDDGTIFFISLFDGGNPALQNNLAALSALGSRCFRNSVTLDLFPASGSMLSRLQRSTVNLIQRFWRQVNPGNYHIRAMNPPSFRPRR